MEVTNVKDWTGSNAMGKRIPFGFTIETMRLKSFNCGAASEKEKKRWTIALQEALDASLLIEAEEEVIEQKPSFLPIRTQKESQIFVSPRLPLPRLNGFKKIVGYRCARTRSKTPSIRSDRSR